jgi:multidrug resistance efflux pump
MAEYDTEEVPAGVPGPAFKSEQTVIWEEEKQEILSRLQILEANVMALSSASAAQVKAEPRSHVKELAQRYVDFVNANRSPESGPSELETKSAQAFTAVGQMLSELKQRIEALELDVRELKATLQALLEAFSSKLGG